VATCLCLSHSSRCEHCCVSPPVYQVTAHSGDNAAENQHLGWKFCLLEWIVDWKCASAREALIRNPRMVALDGFSSVRAPASSEQPVCDLSFPHLLEWSVVPSCCPVRDAACCSGCSWASSVQALGVHSFCLFTRYIFLIIFAANRDVKTMNSSCSLFYKFLKTHFNVCCSLQEHESRTRRMNCQCSLEVAGLGQQLSSLALLSVVSSLFQSPFQATN